MTRYPAQKDEPIPELPAKGTFSLSFLTRRYIIAAMRGMPDEDCFGWGIVIPHVEGYFSSQMLFSSEEDLRAFCREFVPSRVFVQCTETEDPTAFQDLTKPLDPVAVFKHWFDRMLGHSPTAH